MVRRYCTPTQHVLCYPVLLIGTGVLYFVFGNISTFGTSISTFVIVSVTETNEVTVQNLVTDCV